MDSIPPPVSGDNALKQGYVLHVYRPTFLDQSNGKEFEFLRPQHGYHGGLQDSRFRARHDTLTILKTNLRHFQSSEIKKQRQIFNL